MVQGLSSSQMGSVQRQGITADGRVKYQITNSAGNDTKNISVPQAQADVFEKTYNNMIKIAPEIEQYTKKMSDPEEVKKQRKKSNLTMFLGALTGFSIPAMLIRKSKSWVKILSSIGGTIAGLAGGMAIVMTLFTPKCVKQFKSVMTDLSKIDIREEE